MHAAILIVVDLAGVRLRHRVVGTHDLALQVHWLRVRVVEVHICPVLGVFRHLVLVVRLHVAGLDLGVLHGGPVHGLVRVGRSVVGLTHLVLDFPLFVKNNV